MQPEWRKYSFCVEDILLKVATKLQLQRFDWLLWNEALLDWKFHWNVSHGWSLWCKIEDIRAADTHTEIFLVSPLLRSEMRANLPERFELKTEVFFSSSSDQGPPPLFFVALIRISSWFYESATWAGGFFHVIGWNLLQSQDCLACISYLRPAASIYRNKTQSRELGRKPRYQIKMKLMGLLKDLPEIIQLTLTNCCQIKLFKNHHQNDRFR